MWNLFRPEKKKNRKPAFNTQYSQWRGLWEFEAFCPASRFVTVDNDEARKPPLAIPPNVMHNLNSQINECRNPPR